VHLITFGKHAFKYYNINATLGSNITKVSHLFLQLTACLVQKSLSGCQTQRLLEKTIHFKVGIDRCLKSVNQSVSYLLAM